MTEITARTGLVTVSLGSGSGAEVIFLFTSDICGESERLPRHARSYGDIGRLHRQIDDERLAALSAFRTDIRNNAFPNVTETASIPDEAFENFLKRVKS